MKKIGGVGMIKTKFVFAVSVFALLAVNSAWAGAPSSGEALGAAHDVFTEQSPTSGAGIAGVSYVNKAVNVAGAAAQAAEAHAAAAGAAAAEAKSALTGKQDISNIYTNINDVLEGQDANVKYPSVGYVDAKIDALDYSDAAQTGKYVSSVTEVDGKISVSREDLPTIPTVNNATLTIQKNGTSVATFSANSGTAATANITVPTGKLADKNTISDEDVAADAAIAQSKISGLTADLSAKELSSNKKNSLEGVTQTEKGVYYPTIGLMEDSIQNANNDVMDAVNSKLESVSSTGSGVVKSVVKEGTAVKATLGTVGSADITDLAVENADIKDGAVTAVKTSGVIGMIPKGSATATDYANIWVQ